MPAVKKIFILLIQCSSLSWFMAHSWCQSVKTVLKEFLLCKECNCSLGGAKGIYEVNEGLVVFRTEQMRIKTSYNLETQW